MWFFWGIEGDGISQELMEVADGVGKRGVVVRARVLPEIIDGQMEARGVGMMTKPDGSL